MTTATLEQAVVSFSGQAYEARAALLMLFAETAAADYDPHPVAFRALLRTHLGRGEISVEEMLRLSAEAWEMATGEYPVAERGLSDALVVTDNFAAGWSITWKLSLTGEQLVLRCSASGKMSVEIGE